MWQGPKPGACLIFTSRLCLEDAQRRELLETLPALEATHPGHYSRPSSSQEPVVVRRMPVLERLPWRKGCVASTAKWDVKCPASVEHNVYNESNCKFRSSAVSTTPHQSRIDGLRVAE